MDAFIYIKSNNIDYVINSLNECVLGETGSTNPLILGGVSFETHDFTKEMEYTLDFINKRQLESRNLVFDGKLDMGKFVTCVTVTTITGTIFSKILDELVDKLSCALSENMQVQTYYFIRNFDDPIKAFENGHVLFPS